MTEDENETAFEAEGKIARGLTPLLLEGTLLPAENATEADRVLGGQRTALTVRTSGTFALPSIIAGAGPKASKRFAEFFTVPIRNKNTRQAYFHAASTFLYWCEQRGLELETIEPIHVAAYIENHPGSAPTQKQHMAAIRMLFSWMVEKGVLAMNPAREVKTEKFSRSEGKTPAFTTEEIRSFSAALRRPRCWVSATGRSLRSWPTPLRSVSAVASLKVKDYVQMGRRSLIRLHEKGGKERDIPCHHLLEEYLDAYLAAAGIAEAKDAPLFRSIRGKGKKLGLTERPSAPNRCLCNGAAAVCWQQASAATSAVTVSGRRASPTTWNTGATWKWRSTSPVMPTAARPSCMTDEDRRRRSKTLSAYGIKGFCFPNTISCGKQAFTL